VVVLAAQQLQKRVARLPVLLAIHMLAVVVVAAGTNKHLAQVVVVLLVLKVLVKMAQLVGLLAALLVVVVVHVVRQLRMLLEQVLHHQLVLVGRV